MTPLFSRRIPFLPVSQLQSQLQTNGNNEFIFFNFARNSMVPSKEHEMKLASAPAA